MGKIHSRLFRKSYSIPLIQPTQKIESQFPLFRLPQLAFKIVIDLMDFSEQVSLSLSSRRVNLIIKNIRHRPQTLEVWGYNKDCISISTGVYKSLHSPRNFHFVLGAKKMCSDIDISETVLIRGHIVPIKLIEAPKGKCYFDTFWEDENFGLRVIGDYVCDLFREDLCAIQIHNDHHRMFNWVINRQSFIDIIYLRGPAKMKGKEFRYDASKSNTKQLVFHEIVLKNPQTDLFNKKLDLLTLCDCNWIKMKQLLRVETVQLNIENSKLTNKDINTFLKHWVNGGNPFLKFLSIDKQDMNIEKCVSGLRNNLLRGAEVERRFLAKSGHEYRFHHIGIRRNDGTTASMTKEGKQLRLGVWPDEMGRSFDSFV